MGQPITILGSTSIWPTTGDTGYSAGALQTVQLLAAAVKPIEGLYNPNAPLPHYGTIGIDNNGDLIFNGLPVGSGSVTSVAVASPNDITVSGSPITTSGTINIDLATTGVTAGTYTLADITVDSKGRITSASSGTPPAGGTVTSVSASGLQGVTTNITDPTTTPNIEVGLGDITPLSTTLTSGNLTFSGTNQRIRGDFTSSGNTKVAVQSSVSNGDTIFGVFPNGTSSDSSFIARNTNGPNGNSIQIGSSFSENYISSTAFGSGTSKPFNIKHNGSDTISILSGGQVSISNVLTVSGSISASNLSGTNTGNQTITATGDATGVSTGTPATSLPLTLANTTVVPGPYTSANITVDSKGRITSASNGSQGVWGSITGNINTQTDLNKVFNMIGNVTIGTGVTTTTDTVGLIALNDTTVRLKPTTQAVFSTLIPGGLYDADRTFPQQDYALANLTFPSDGIFVRFIGVDTTGLVVTSPASFKNSPNVLQYGYLLVKQVAGVKTFLDGAAGPRNVFTWPDFAGNNAAESEYFTPITNIIITPNANLTVQNTTGVIKGLNINWGTANVNERAVLSQNPTTFTTINPSTALAASLPAPGTAVQVTQYWNGSAMTNLGGANQSTVQRFFVTINGGLFLQVGEVAYANFATAIDNISVAPFTDIIPPESFIEIVRFASRNGSTNLSINSDAVFSTSSGGGGGGGGSSAGTVTSVNVAGAQGVTAVGGPITSSGSITVGLGDITPTTVSTGTTTIAGNIEFTGLGRRIRGDMTDASAVNRLAFQTSTLNGSTNIGILPNGSNTASNLQLTNNSNPVNAGIGLFSTNATRISIGSAILGSGTLLPTQLVTGSNIGITVDVSGNIVVGNIGILSTTATSGFFYLNSMAGTPTGVPGVPVGSGGPFSSKVAITADVTGNLLYFYSGGAWRNVISGNTGVTPGTYTAANITVNAEGRITAAASGGGGGGGSVTSVNVVSTTLQSTGGPISTNGDITVDLPGQSSGGSYTNANITVDNFGRVITASSGASGAPAGSNTEIQFNNSGAFGASSNLTYDGTKVSLNGNLEIAGSARRITADFSIGSLVNRTLFQTSTTNNNTTIGIIPNGTGNTSEIRLYNNSTPTAATTGLISMTSSVMQVGSGVSSAIPVNMIVGGTAYISIESTGSVVLGQKAGLSVSASDGFVYVRSMASSPAGVPTTVSNQTAITVDTGTGHLWTYSGGAWHDPTIIEQNIQSVAYTCVFTDAGKHILHPSADTTARIFTIPANASVPYKIGTTLMFVNQNAGGVITIAITTDTMRLAGAGTTGSRTLAANGIATALKITATEWIINGTGLT